MAKMDKMTMDLFNDPKSSKVLATIGADGFPNAVPVQSLAAIDEKTLAFTVVAIAKTKYNLLEQSKVSTVVYQIPAKGCQVKGTFTGFITSGEIFDRMAAMIEKVLKIKVYEVGIIEVAEVFPLQLAKVPEASPPKAVTISEVEVKPLYTPADIADLNYSRDLGYPGNYPYTRGVYPYMYSKQPWTQRMVSGFGTSEESNERLKYLTAHGETGLNVVFDLPTHYGLDSDHELAEGEVGKEGVPIDSILDMDALFKDIDLADVSTSLITNYLTVFSYYVAVAQNRGIPIERLAGTTQNDACTSFAGAKVAVVPIRPHMKLSLDIVEFAMRNMPRWNPVSIVGYHYREKGCNAIQEIALTLCTGIAYLTAGMERGLDIDQFAPRLSFFFGAHNDFFEEIAKFRAARRLWARIARERFGAKDPRSWRMRFHTQTAGSSLTARQPMNNIVRTTIQALAAVLGGTQSLHTNSYDEALALPTEESVEIALRTQQIIAHESGVTNTIDPIAGSYYVEHLTNTLEKLSLEIIEKVDRMGGMIKAIEEGWVENEISDASYRYGRSIEKGERVIVGVSRYERPGEEITMKLLKIDPALEKKQLQRLERARNMQNGSAVRSALEKVRQSARKNENLIPAVIDATREYATIGQIFDVFRDVYGTAKWA
jgi:methylmalonyl-CoA mutase N-terminal domain/subunit